MTLRVNNNIAALNSRRHLNANNRVLNVRLERLASGLKLNRAADDAAGLSVREGMRAEISGLNLSEPLGREALLKLHRALLMYQVLFVLDQTLTPEQQIRFSRQLGDLEPYPFSKGLKNYPEITEVVKLPDEYVNFGSGWHVDMSFNQSPPDGAALYAVEIPPAGGDTIFCNLTLAYNMLSEGHRAMLERVRGVHDSRTRYQMVNALKGMSMVDGDEFFRCVQPLTRIHPETADTSLFISPDYLFQLEEIHLCILFLNCSIQDQIHYFYLV